MVNNAGISQVQPLADVTPQEVETIFKVNIEGVLWGIQAAAKKFRDRGQKGKIINASSVAGHNGFAMLGVTPVLTQLFRSQDCYRMWTNRRRLELGRCAAHSDRETNGILGHPACDQ